MVGKSRRTSSSRWLERQNSDTFVKKAKQEGFRSRAAYKLLEIQEKDKLLAKGMRVVDLGAAPGGWSQVAAKIVGPLGKVIALDILPMESLPGVDIIQGDFGESSVLNNLQAHLESQPVDVVISDMAPNLSGISSADQARSMQLVDLAIALSEAILKEGGALLIKVFQGAEFQNVVATLKQSYQKVVVRKPKASRAESREVYLLAKGYNRGHKEF